MAETGSNAAASNTGRAVPERELSVRHRGRLAQIGIFFFKFLKMFIQQGDWKVLPMSALIAGLVSIVISEDFLLTAEGTMIGALAMTCVCIWNGCFNSIQVICRERDVIKREHRSGMHISSYILAHMMYQLLLCVMQTVVTLYMTKLLGVRYPDEGMFTPWFLLDFGITMFLITYASDMMSLFISSICHSTTTAMTIMPFVLIFQLVFSGSMLTLPAAVKPVSSLTISCPGINAMSAQADTNKLPYAVVPSILQNVKGGKIKATVTLGQVLDLLSDENNETIRGIRELEIGKETTIGGMMENLGQSDLYAELRETEVAAGFTLGDILNMLDGTGALDQYKDYKISPVTTVGEAVDYLAQNESVKARRDESITIETTAGDVISLIGENNVREFLSDTMIRSGYNPLYEQTRENVLGPWLTILLFAAVFAALSIVSLEFIDKDKR